MSGKSTMNRLELTKEDASPEKHYKKIRYDAEAIHRFIVTKFLESHIKDPPKQIILDLEATDDTVHGK